MLFDGRSQFFGLQIPNVIRRLLVVRRQQIALFETIAVCVASIVFMPFITNAEVVWFVDNTNTVAWLRNGFARKDSRDANFLVADFWLRLLNIHSTVHIEWVPSALNIADGPSRPSHPELLQPLRSRHSKRIDPPFPAGLRRVLLEGFSFPYAPLEREVATRWLPSWTGGS